MSAMSQAIKSGTVVVTVIAGLYGLSGVPEVEAPGQVLMSPGQDVHLELASASVYVHFNQHRDGLEVHLLVHDHADDGEVLRTRTVLVDGQSYILRLDGEDDALPREARPGFSVQRVGDKVIATALNGPKATVAGIFPALSLK